LFVSPFRPTHKNRRDSKKFIASFDAKLFFLNIFSSPELKAQVSYSDRLLSVVRLSVRKLLHFRLLLQNRWTNFNQTWHKSSLGEGDLSLFK
jgi:hypothetical protein